MGFTPYFSPGSSGSPVFNSKGEVIGVAYSSYDIGQNLNFAIPVSYVTNLLNDYKKSQKKVMHIQKAPLSVLTPETMVKLEKAKSEVKKNPDNAEAHNNLGLCYIKLDKYQEAFESFKQAIKMKPDYAEAHNNLGLCYFKLDKYQEAMESCKQAIKLKPDYVDAHFYLGIVYIKQNDRGAALEEYKILEKLNPELANEFFNLLYEYYL
jgi:tetratricopeptide (TPR) repeat protein